MNNRVPELMRLEQLLSLVGKEDSHLQAVRDRLIPTDCQFDLEWLEATLSDNIGVDRLESFSSKFARMQDTMIDKLLPQHSKSQVKPPWLQLTI